MISKKKGGALRMESFEPKKLALIRILQILKSDTDSNHPLTHKQIASKLESDYNITVERKAVGRNLSLLEAAGYEIVTTKSGSYLADRTFEDSELKLLSDSVLSSRHISSTHTKQLITKIASLSNKYFRPHVKNVYSVKDWSKSENSALFYNIDVLDDAIANNRKVSFVYNKYGIDKKPHRSACHLTSPYQMILHNQRYFLMAYQEKWKHIRFYRLDRISDIEFVDEPATPLRSIEGFENGIDYKRFSSSLPYMYSDEPTTITFSIDGEWMIDQIVDWFGFDFKTTKDGDKIIITVKASPDAMEFWLMQYLNNVEVLSPPELRARIAKNIENAFKKYKGAIKNE